MNRLARRWFHRGAMPSSGLTQPRRAYGLWFGRHCVWAAWLGLSLAVLSPPRGLGVALCSFAAATGLPCPGCGLTRSLSCALRGLFLESWSYHPMGLFILGLFLVIAAQSIGPRSFRDWLARWMERHAGMMRTFYVLFVVTFVGFGTIRAALSLTTPQANALLRPMLTER